MIVNRPLAETVPIVLQRINEVLHMATLTDDIYWAHFDPQVQALRNVPFSDSKAHTLATLATQGFIIDMPIMGWNWDPVLVMQYRQQYGYTWVPSLLQPNIAVAPGVSQPGTAPYDPLHPPAGSIKVSLDANDILPFKLRRRLYRLLALRRVLVGVMYVLWERVFLRITFKTAIRLVKTVKTTNFMWDKGLWVLPGGWNYFRKDL